MGRHRCPRPRHRAGRQAIPPGGGIRLAPMNSSLGTRGGLPAQLTSFIGRDRECEQVGSSLQDASLLTLTGVGGIGKTRLAHQVATEQLERFPEAVRWVDLGSLTEAASVADAVAEAFAIRPLPGMTSLQAVCASLAGRRALIVLDNCEHLLDASAELAEELGKAAPNVRLLATSRAPLGIASETRWDVPVMSVPESTADPIGAVRRSEAGQLFVDRAGRADDSFTLSDENARAVVRICEELEGLPLALELAAARARILSSEQIADALADRLRLLGGGPQRVVQRHQTLRASIDWSHELLDEPERIMFRRLSIFIGDYDLDAAENVCAF